VSKTFHDVTFSAVAGWLSKKTAAGSNGEETTDFQAICPAAAEGTDGWLKKVWC